MKGSKTLLLAAGVLAGVVVALALGIAFTVMGGKASGSTTMVWCAAPGETVDAAFKAEYPELRMPKSECDSFNR